MAQAFKKIIVNVAPESLFNVIVDYESYPKFLSTIRNVKILERKKGKIVAEFEAKVFQPFHYTLELEENRPASVTWRMLDGDFMRKNEGKWKLKLLKGKQTEALYQIDVELSRLVPGFIVQRLVEESLPKTLDEFRDRAESLATKSQKKSTSKR